MRTVGQIIRERREALGLTLSALAQEVGATKSYLSMIENHRVANPPSAALLRALERALQIGDGDLQHAADWQNTPREVREQIEKLSTSAQKGEELARWLIPFTSPRKDGARNLDKLFASGELKKLVRSTLNESAGPGATLDPQVGVRFRVPLINQVAAGYPAGFTDLDYPASVADEYVAVPEINDSHAFAARVVGESMLPEYHEGDIVVFSPAAKITAGSDCFLRLLPNHETTFKRVFFDKNPEGKETGGIRLQPLNPQFPPTVLDRHQIAGMYKAVWRFQKLGT